MLAKKWHIILPIIVAIASSIDLAFTITALRIPNGVFTEANPIMKYALDNHGEIATATFKLVMTGFQCWITWWIIKQRDWWSTFVLSFITLTSLGLLMLWWTFCWFCYFSMYNNGILSYN